MSMHFRMLLSLDISLDISLFAIAQDISFRPVAVPAIAARSARGLECADVCDLLPRAEAGRLAGDAARVSDADGGHGAGSGRAPGRRFLLPVACRAGEGRAQS